MTKARDLANLISTGAPLADGTIAVTEVTGAAPLASPTFTGTPSAPTAATSANTTQIATTAFVKADIANLVDSSPDALNTLNELAAALGDDANFSTTVTNNIATKAPLSNPTFSGTATATAFVGDGSGLTGIQGNSFDATASGALANGDPVILNANGTVSKPAITQNVNDPATKGYNNAVSYNTSSTSSVSAAYNSASSGNGKGAFMIVFKDGTDNNLKGNAMTVRSDGELNIEGEFNIETTNIQGDDDADIVYDSNSNCFLVVYIKDFYTDVKVNALTGNSSSNPRSYTVGSMNTIAQVSSGEGHRYPRIASNGSGGFVCVYTKGSGSHLYCKGFTYNGSSYSFGSETQITNNTVSTASIVYDSASSRFAVSFIYTGVDSTVRTTAVTLSGTSVSVPGGQTLSSVTSNGHNLASVYTTNGKIVLAFRDSSNSYYGSTVVGTYNSGTNKYDFGSVQVFNSANSQFPSIGYDSNLNRVAIFYKDGGNSGEPTLKHAAVGTNSLTFQSNVLILASSTANKTVDRRSERLPFSGINMGNGYDDNKMLIPWVTTSPNGFVNIVNLGSSATTLTTSNYIGISDAAYSDGATATIQTMGAIDDAQSGMTIGAKQYVQPDGTISGTEGSPSVEAGLAVSATKLLVKG